MLDFSGELNIWEIVVFFQLVCVVLLLIFVKTFFCCKAEVEILRYKLKKKAS